MIALRSTATGMAERPVVHQKSAAGMPSPKGEDDLNICRSRGDEALVKNAERTIADDVAISRTIVPRRQSRIAQRFNAGFSGPWSLKSRRDDRILCRDAKTHLNFHHSTLSLYYPFYPMLPI